MYFRQEPGNRKMLLFQNGIDRNVRIDAIAIDGIRFETEAPDVFSTGTWKPEDGIVPGFRQDEFLHTDGYFQYADTNPGGSRLQVRAGGDEGDCVNSHVPINSVCRFTLRLSTHHVFFRIRQTPQTTCNGFRW